jgi:F-type H+-transporting ATPase subunit delta
MMRSASREAVTQLRRRREEVVGARASSKRLTALAGELYAVADLLVAQPRLRRILGDPATAPQARADLVGRLLDGKAGEAAVRIAQAAVSQRWSSPWDLTDALEAAGDDTLFAAAEHDGVLDRVEDELFRFERILQAEGELATLLDEKAAPAERREHLLQRVLGTKAHALTRELLVHAVRSDRKRSVGLAIDDLLEAASARRERSVARVLSAVELTDEQQQRLTGALSELYGRPISLRTAVDRGLRGGLVVRVGDEVIDGSIAARLLEARAALTR